MYYYDQTYWRDVNENIMSYNSKMYLLSNLYAIHDVWKGSLPTTDECIFPVSSFKFPNKDKGKYFIPRTRGKWAKQ